MVNELSVNYKTNVRVEIWFNYKLDDIMHNFEDLTPKITFRLCAKVSFGEGIKKFADWVINQVIMADK